MVKINILTQRNLPMPTPLSYLYSMSKWSSLNKGINIETYKENRIASKNTKNV